MKKNYTALLTSIMLAAFMTNSTPSKSNALSSIMTHQVYPTSFLSALSIGFSLNIFSWTPAERIATNLLGIGASSGAGYALERVSIANLSLGQKLMRPFVQTFTLTNTDPYLFRASIATGYFMGSLLGFGVNRIIVNRKSIAAKIAAIKYKLSKNPEKGV